MTFILDFMEKTIEFLFSDKVGIAMSSDYNGALGSIDLEMNKTFIEEKNKLVVSVQGTMNLGATFTRYLYFATG